MNEYNPWATVSYPTTSDMLNQMIAPDQQVVTQQNAPVSVPTNQGERQQAQPTSINPWIFSGEAFSR